MKDNEKLIPLHKIDDEKLEHLEEGETFGVKDKKLRFVKNSLNHKTSTDLLSNNSEYQDLDRV